MSLRRRTLLATGAALPLLGRPARAARRDGPLRFGLSSYPPSFHPGCRQARLPAPSR